MGNISKDLLTAVARVEPKAQPALVDLFDPSLAHHKSQKMFRTKRALWQRTAFVAVIASYPVAAFSTQKKTTPSFYSHCDSLQTLPQWAADIVKNKRSDITAVKFNGKTGSATITFANSQETIQVAMKEKVDIIFAENDSGRLIGTGSTGTYLAWGIGVAIVGVAVCCMFPANCPFEAGMAGMGAAGGVLATGATASVGDNAAVGAATVGTGAMATAGVAVASAAAASVLLEDYEKYSCPSDASKMLLIRKRFRLQ